MKAKSHSKEPSLKVLNDFYLIEEDEMELQESTESVRSAVKDGKLILPDSYESFLKKYPFTGIVVSHGEKVIHKLVEGTRVIFPRHAKAILDGMEGPHGRRLILIRDYDLVAYYVE